MIIKIATVMAYTGMVMMGIWGFWNTGMILDFVPQVDILTDAYLGVLALVLFIFLWGGGVIICLYGIEIGNTFTKIKKFWTRLL